MPSPAAQVGFSFLPFRHTSSFNLHGMYYARGVINGKAGKAAALPKFSDMLSLLQSGLGADYAQTLALPHLYIFRDYAPVISLETPILLRTMCKKSAAFCNYF